MFVFLVVCGSRIVNTTLSFIPNNEGQLHGFPQDICHTLSFCALSLNVSLLYENIEIKQIIYV